MRDALDRGHWDVLVDRVRDERCTPFLGAGAAAGTLPLGGELARRWAQADGYPLQDSSDLARVSQFLAVKFDPMTPKERIARLISATGSPDFETTSEPHMVLAGLPLPIFLTTNFDDFMMQALRKQGKKPRQELCRWNERLQRRPSILESADGWEPTVDEPLVYHLHGHADVPESLVLTEDDYFDFLVNIPQIGIPPVIQEALSATSLLFVGYRLADWNFRVLFRGFVELTQPSDRRLSVTVQLPPTPSQEHREQAMEYLGHYFRKKEMVVYWGEARDFVKDLSYHWLRASDGS
jgi:hypothetical protein